MPLLLGQACMPNLEKVHAMATDLVRKLRGKRSGGGVEGLIQEFSLSSQEGVALMCLAEALLRIPDRATRDALIRDKLRAATGNRIWAVCNRCSSTPPPGA